MTSNATAAMIQDFATKRAAWLAMDYFPHVGDLILGSLRSEISGGKA
jgi:hypothetical protein